VPPTTDQGRPVLQADARGAATAAPGETLPQPETGASGGLFALLYDLAPVGYAILDVGSRILDINPAGAALLGGKRTDWLERSIASLLQPEQRQDFLAQLGEACARPDPLPEAPFVLDVALPPSAPDVRLLRIFFRLHPSGANRLCFATMLDVSAELLAKSRRREVERHQQAVLDALSAQIAVLDATGRITAVNEAWRRFARENGGSPELEEGVGLNYFHACCASLSEESEGAAGRALEGIQAVMNGERPEFTLEYPCHSAQQQRWFLMTVTPLGGGERGAVVAHMDISERVRAEQESRLRREEVAHASRLSSVTVLAASLVHELSQPLAAASLYGESVVALGKREPLDRAQLLSVVGDLRGQVDRAVGIVEGLRRFMRRGELKTEPCALEERVVEAMTLVGPLARRKRIRMKLDPVKESIPVLGNPLQIEQVLVNLLCNGIEAIDRAGREVRRIHVNADTLDGMARVTVADTGPGLSPNWSARIFDVFETEKETGMGMGLAVSRTIVEAHGGRLWAEPGVEEGATLRFTLPLRRDEAVE
jgi:two-component system, LuxR family, sensor kinase FixL